MKLYKKFIIAILYDIQYIEADPSHLDKYWKWIYTKKEDTYKEVEKTRKYILALNNKNKNMVAYLLKIN